MAGLASDEDKVLILGQRDFENRGITLQDKVAAGFILTAVILAFLGFALFSSLASANEATQWSIHSYKVLYKVDSLYAHLLNSHRSQRGFIITGNESFLKPYYESKKDARQELFEALEMTKDNPKQQQYLGELGFVLNEALDYFDSIIAKRRVSSIEVIQRTVTVGQGERLMTQAKSTIEKIQHLEESLLAQRLTKSREQDSAGRILTIIGASLVLIILMSVYYLVNREIAECQRANREMMEARNEAQQVSRMKSEFLANMSHEIRTPMNGILGMAEILSNTDMALEQRRYLQMIDASGRSLLTIINDILDFSKIEAGKLTLDPIRFKLRETVGEVLYPFSRLAAEKNLELLFHIKSDVPNYVVGDPHRLRQILNNLVGNAIKFTHKGEIYVGMEIESQQDNRLKVHAWVSDTGIGLSKDKLALIFEPFMQADGSTTRKFGGTGLGLSICRQLVHMMNGRMWVDSTEKQGSTFHFVVELDVAEKAETPIIPTDIAKLKGMPVLVVDDNATSREIFREFLKEWEMVPMLVENAQMALDIMRHAAHMGNAYPLALLDVGMPDVDGFMLAEQIKNDPNLKETKIILLTSYGLSGDAARCQELNVDGYLTKPVGQQSLLYCIRSVFSPNFRAKDKQRTGESHEDDNTSESMIERRLLTEHDVRPRMRPLKILLVEDNEINQTVALHMLQEANHWVDVAENGKVALACLAKNAYDLVLMDIHMPEMDGFEATAHIRNDEIQTGKHMPIIALTANAIKGDRELCLEAGMDGYLSKPFRKHELLGVLEEVLTQMEKGYCALPGAKVPEQESEGVMINTVKPAKPSEPLLDEEAIMERVDNDLGLLNQLIEMFSRMLPDHMSSIESAINNQDARQLEESAHTLKGAIGNFTEKSPYLAAKNLEMLGKESNLTQASSAFETLKLEVDALGKELDLMSENTRTKGSV